MKRAEVLAALRLARRSLEAVLATASDDAAPVGSPEWILLPLGYAVRCNALVQRVGRYAWVPLYEVRDAFGVVRFTNRSAAALADVFLRSADKWAVIEPALQQLERRRS